MGASTLKVYFGICAKGLKFEKVSQTVGDGLAEIKKVDLIEKFKGGMGKLKNKIMNAVTLTTVDDIITPKEDVKSFELLSKLKNKNDFSKETLEALMNSFKDKYQPVNC